MNPDTSNPFSYGPSVAIPSTANRILPYAFNGNTALKKIVIPASVTEIGDYAFIGATDLQIVKNLAEIPQQINEATFAGLNRNAIHLIVPAGKTQAYRDAGWTGFSITENVGGFTTTASDGEVTITGFAGAIPADIEIPMTYNGLPVTKIGDNAFIGQTRLISLTIPASVTGIGNNVFAGCSNLATMYMDRSVVEHGSVTTLGTRGSGCSTNVEIYVPDGFSVVAYKQAANWGCMGLLSPDPSWIAPIYTITLNHNGGTGLTDTAYLKYYYSWHLQPDGSDNVSGIVPPERNDYNFDGYWTTVSGTGTQIINANGTWASGKTTAFTANGMLYARWIAKTYTITYLDVGGGALSGEFLDTKPMTHKYGTTTNLVAPQKFGYIFEGWYTNSSGSGSPITSLGTSHSGNITLYAKWAIHDGDWKTVNYTGGWSIWWRDEAHSITLLTSGASFNASSQFRLRTADGSPLEFEICSNAATPSSSGVIDVNSVSSYSIAATGSDVWNLNDTFIVYYNDLAAVELSAVYASGKLVFSATVLIDDQYPGWYMWLASYNYLIVEVYEPIVWREVDSIGGGDIWWCDQDYFVTLFAPGAVFDANTQFRLRTTDGSPFCLTIDNNVTAPNSIGIIGINSLSSYAVTADGSDVWNLSDRYIIYYYDDIAAAEVSAVYANGQLVFSVTLLMPEPYPGWFGWISFGDIVIEALLP